MKNLYFNMHNVKTKINPSYYTVEGQLGTLASYINIYLGAVISVSWVKWLEDNNVPIEEVGSP